MAQQNSYSELTKKADALLLKTDGDRGQALAEVARLYAESIKALPQVAPVHTPAPRQLSETEQQIDKHLQKAKDHLKKPDLYAEPVNRYMPAANEYAAAAKLTAKTDKAQAAEYYKLAGDAALNCNQNVAKDYYKASAELLAPPQPWYTRLWAAIHPQSHQEPKAQAPQAEAPKAAEPKAQGTYAQLAKTDLPVDKAPSQPKSDAQPSQPQPEAQHRSAIANFCTALMSCFSSSKAPEPKFKRQKPEVEPEAQLGSARNNVF